jgi:hypothetical protein
VICTGIFIQLIRGGRDQLRLEDQKKIRALPL